MTRSDSSALLSPAAAPLTRPKHERFAQLVALGLPLLEAARQAGYEWNGTAIGNAANARRLAQRRRIKARVQWHRENRDAKAREEMRRIAEERLLLWHEADIGDYYEEREEPIFDRKGNPVRDVDGNIITRLVERPKPLSGLTLEQRKVIKSRSYTESGKLNLELYSAIDANRDIRKLNGLDAQPLPEEGDAALALPDDKLFAELTRQAAELGVDLKMTFEVFGAED